MSKKKSEETPDGALTLDADHVPPTGSYIRAYETPFGTLTARVDGHQEIKGLGLVQENRGGIHVTCATVMYAKDEQFVGKPLMLYYGTRYTQE